MRVELTSFFREGGLQARDDTMVPPTAPSRSPYQSLPMILLRSRLAMMRQFRPLLRAFNLSEQQWRVLRILESISEIEIKDLARTTCLVPPSLSRILKNLNERGLIARRRSDEDMRHGFVSISCEGRMVVDDMEPVAESIFAEIARRCGDLPIEALETLLSRLTDELEENERIEAGQLMRIDGRDGTVGPRIPCADGLTILGVVA